MTSLSCTLLTRKAYLKEVAKQLLPDALIPTGRHIWQSVRERWRR